MSRKISAVFVFAAGILSARSLLAAEIRLPRYTRTELPNGVVTILIPRPGIPLVQFRIVVKGGVESEPAGKAGLATLTSQLLRKGTGTRSAGAFSDELDGLGGTFNSFVSEEGTVVTAEFLRKDFEPGFALVSDALLHPTFPELEVKKLVGQSVDRVRALKDSPQAAIGQYFRAFFFGPRHPYGRVPDEATYGGITRDDVVAFHKSGYVARNMIVIVSGDFEPSTAAPVVANVFGAVEAGTQYRWKEEAKPLPGGRLLLIDKPDSTQTYFAIGQPGLRRTDPGLTGMRLINTLFGGRFTSMLNDELRVNTGLSYGASCTFSQDRQPGTLTINTYTRTETTERAMDLALEVLKRFHEKGISAEQLASAKAYVKGTFPPQRLETTDQIAAEVSDLEIYGLNKGDIDDMFSRIDAFTLPDANALVKKRYGTGPLTFVVLGNAAKIRSVVKKYAPEMVEVPVTAPGFTSWSK